MRKPITKSIRFEVFKRDKFTCQYCGKKAPDVVLHVDHIDPVSKGGNNDIVNLVTSCFDCNLGKGSKKLSDNSAIDKQRKQLELVQERREQIELMFEWKKSLSKLDSQTNARVKRYVNAKIKPFTISDSAYDKIKLLLKKHEVNAVLEAVDVAATRYLRFGHDGNLTRESASEFIDKIGGVLFNKSLPPVAQKISYIKGVARNRFNYFDQRAGAILLNNYVAALRTHWNYDDAAILQDLDSEVLPRTQECKNWSEWRGILEGWIESIKNGPEEKVEVSDEF